MTVEKALDFITEIKKYKDIPIGLLMYYNLIFQYGTEKFFSDFHKAGVNSVLVADLSIDDADEIIPAREKSGLDTVFMVTPNTSNRAFETNRLKNHRLYLYRFASGRNRQPENLSISVKGLISRIKKHNQCPRLRRLRNKQTRTRRAVAKAGADGVIIGSKIVGIIEENLKKPNICTSKVVEFLSKVRKAVEK